MSLSSTSSSDTLQLNWRPIVRSVAVTVLFVLLLDVTWRAVDPFEYYGGWENPDLERKMARAEQAWNEHKRLDVLTLSSSVGRAIDVNQWEDALGGDVICLNGGGPDFRPEVQRFLFEHVYWPRFKPSHVLYAISARDATSRLGRSPERYRAGAFWNQAGARRLIAKLEGSIAARLLAWLEETSSLYRARQHARAAVHHGMPKPQEMLPTFRRDVEIPSPRRIATGPHPKTWMEHPLYREGGAYYWYYISEQESEIDELIALARFCRKRDVKFEVIEVATPPLTMRFFDAPDRDYYGTFRGALKRLEAEGVTVHLTPDEVYFDNSTYQDFEHVNRWGAQLLTDYAYQVVIRNWFPNKTRVASLSAPEQVNLYRSLPNVAQEAKVTRFLPKDSNVQYASSRQVIVSKGKVTLPIEQELAPGNYAIELYAGDGTTTSPEQTGEASLKLRCTLAGAGLPIPTELNQWSHARMSTGYTQYHIVIPTTGTLQLEVENPTDHPLILDSAFLRRKVGAEPEGSVMALDWKTK